GICVDENCRNQLSCRSCKFISITQTVHALFWIVIRSGRRASSLHGNMDASTMLRVVAGVLSWLLPMCVCLLAPAQVISGSIDAAVVDPAGAAVPDATVTAVNNSTGRPYTCVTRSDGRCRVEGFLRALTRWMSAVLALRLGRLEMYLF